MNWNFIIFSIVKIAIVIGVVQGMVAYAVLAERKISAWIQDRVGPNRCAPPFAKYIPVVGPALIRLGIFQPLADGLKFMLKEDFTPAGVRKIYFWLAPAHRGDSLDAGRRGDSVRLANRRSRKWSSRI